MAPMSGCVQVATDSEAQARGADSTGGAVAAAAAAAACVRLSRPAPSSPLETAHSDPHSDPHTLRAARLQPSDSPTGSGLVRAHARGEGAEGGSRGGGGG
eukprot:2375572-Rhodomonas_salina.1